MPWSYKKSHEKIHFLPHPRNASVFRPLFLSPSYFPEAFHRRSQRWTALVVSNHCPHPVSLSHLLRSGHFHGWNLLSGEAHLSGFPHVFRNVWIWHLYISPWNLLRFSHGGQNLPRSAWGRSFIPQRGKVPDGSLQSAQLHVSAGLYGFCPP